MGDPTGSHEVPGSAQAAGDKVVVDATILPAVEGMEPFQAERRDVVTGMIDEWNHGSGPPVKPMPSVFGNPLILDNCIQPLPRSVQIGPLSPARDLNADAGAPALRHADPRARNCKWPAPGLQTNLVLSMAESAVQRLALICLFRLLAVVAQEFIVTIVVRTALDERMTRRVEPTPRPGGRPRRLN